MPKSKKVIIRASRDEGPGRPTKYRADMARQAGIMAANGMTERAIAMALGLGYSTFREYRAKHPALQAALQMDKAVADNNVKLTLFQRAMGYDYEEEEVREINGELVRVKVRKHKPADITAIAIWLNNRLPHEFRRNPDPPAEAPAPEPDKVFDITPDNARQIARKFALVLYKGGKVA